MRKSHGTDFHVDVEYTVGQGNDAHPEKIGRFTFGRRTMRDTFLIRSEYNRLTNGNYRENVPEDWGAWAVATLAVLMVASPDAFDIDKIDPLTDDTWEDKVAAIFTALRDKELSFRPNSTPKEQAGSS